MVIYYTRSNGVDDSVMNVHLDNFVQSLPTEVRSTVQLTKHTRGTTYNPQLVVGADLVIVGLKDDEDAVIGRGVYEECLRALQLGKQVLVVRKETVTNEQVFLQEIREADLDIRDDDGADWKRYAEISLFDYCIVTRKPLSVDQHDLDNDVILNFMLGDTEETKEYMRLKYPNFVGSSARTTAMPEIDDMFDVFSSSTVPVSHTENAVNDVLSAWPMPFGGTTYHTPLMGYGAGDTILVTLPEYPGMTFGFTVSLDWLSPQEATDLNKFISGIGLTQSSIEDFVNEVLGKADGWSMTHLWECWNFGEATAVINALERRIRVAGGTFSTILKPREEVVQKAQSLQNTPTSEADAFFNLLKMQPQVKVSRFMSNEDNIAPLGNNDELLLLL